MIFANPPLIELVAELRWVPGSGSQNGAIGPQGGIAQFAQGPMLQFPLSSPHQEETFVAFSNQVAGKGFSVSERLLPVGFPSLPFTVVYRYRKLPAAKENYLYQIGPGLFSANALPPYRDWESFRPIVQEGVQALLQSRHSSENVPFATVILRYIDLFSEEFTEGKASFRFLNEVLGLKLGLPNALIEQVTDMNGVQAGLQLYLPLKNGLAMTLNLQNGMAVGKTGIIMTTEVLTVKPTASELAPVMQTFENAHTSIRVTFLGLTGKLSAKMKPVPQTS